MSLRRPENARSADAQYGPTDFVICAIFIHWSTKFVAAAIWGSRSTNFLLVRKLKLIQIRGTSHPIKLADKGQLTFYVNITDKIHKIMFVPTSSIAMAKLRELTNFIQRESNKTQRGSTYNEVHWYRALQIIWSLQ